MEATRFGETNSVIEGEDLNYEQSPNSFLSNWKSSFNVELLSQEETHQRSTNNTASPSLFPTTKTCEDSSFSPLLKCIPNHDVVSRFESLTRKETSEETNNKNDMFLSCVNNTMTSNPLAIEGDCKLDSFEFGLEQSTENCTSSDNNNLLFSDSFLDQTLLLSPPSPTSCRFSSSSNTLSSEMGEMEKFSETDDSHSLAMPNVVLMRQPTTKKCVVENAVDLSELLLPGSNNNNNNSSSGRSNFLPVIKVEDTSSSNEWLDVAAPSTGSSTLSSYSSSANRSRASSSSLSPLPHSPSAVESDSSHRSDKDNAALERRVNRRRRVRGRKIQSKYDWPMDMLTMERGEFVRFTRTTNRYTKEQLDDLRSARRRMKNRLYQKDARDRKFMRQRNKKDNTLHHLNACVRRLSARCERLEKIIRSTCPEKLADLKSLAAEEVEADDEEW
eukprot:m.44139 g.44139  ORF g.44139 m.44139 type:complete len:444 (+) comp10584_c1_seq1:227-1558(+)